MIKLEQSKLDGMTLEQKFSRSIFDLRKIRPFYASVFECMKREEANEKVQTMAVSIDTLFYNSDFVNSIKYSEFLFVVLHEIAHVALRHVVRMKNHDPSLWNIAADYYVNSLLAEEFGLDLDCLPSTNKTSCGLEITLLEHLLVLSSVDLNLDSVESLYKKLSDQKQNQEDSDEDGDEDGGDGAGSEGGKTFHYKIQGSKKYFGENGISDLKINENEFKSDLIDSPQKSQEEQNAKSEQLLQDAKVRHDMTCEPGSDHGLLYREVEKSLKSKVNWKSLLRRYLISATESDSSYTNPDKRFMYQSNFILPGQVVDDLSKIEGVKICIDVSASIFEDDLSEFLGQVWSICKSFKISAEVLYWDTIITAKGEFTGYKEFERVNQFGGGGTDPACIFDYFNSKECKDKPIVTLIFTDGYVGDSYDTPKNRSKYGRNTMWIMSKDCDPDYKPAFGKVVYPEWKDNSN